MSSDDEIELDIPVSILPSTTVTVAEPTEKSEIDEYKEPVCESEDNVKNVVSDDVVEEVIAEPDEQSQVQVEDAAEADGVVHQTEQVDKEDESIVIDSSDIPAETKKYDEMSKRMTTKALRAMLKNNGLNSNGTKLQMVERLVDHGVDMSMHEDIMLVS